MSRFGCSNIEFAYRRVTESSAGDNDFDYSNETLYDSKESDIYLPPDNLMPLLNSTFVLPEGLYLDETVGDVLGDEDHLQPNSASSLRPALSPTLPPPSAFLCTVINNSNSLDTILSDTSATHDLQVSKRARNNRRNKNKRDREKLDPVLIAKKKEKKRLKYLRRACKYYMSIEFSLCFRLAVLLKYERIAELCERYGNKIDFEPVFQKWLTEKYWLRFHTKGMYFHNVLRHHIRKNHTGIAYRNVCDVNKTYWKSVLNNPEANTVRLDEMTWQVERISDRREEIRMASMPVSTVKRLEYLVEWTTHNGRYFQE